MAEDFAQAAHRVMMEATGRKPKTKPPAPTERVQRLTKTGLDDHFALTQGPYLPPRRTREFLRWRNVGDAMDSFLEILRRCFRPDVVEPADVVAFLWPATLYEGTGAGVMAVCADRNAGKRTIKHLELSIDSGCGAKFELAGRRRHVGSCRTARPGRDSGNRGLDVSPTFTSH